MITMHTKTLLFLTLLPTLTLAVIGDDQPRPSINVLAQKDWSANVKKLAAANPKGLQPAYQFTAPTFPDSDASYISFFATGPTKGGDQGCHGGGSQGDIVIPRADFAGAKLCPSGNGGDGGNDDLEGNGGSFTITGKLGNCQLSFYKNTGCTDGDWLGYMHGSAQRTCNAPYDPKGNLIQGFRSFNYLCPDP